MRSLPEAKPLLLNVTVIKVRQSQLGLLGSRQIGAAASDKTRITVF